MVAEVAASADLVFLTCAEWGTCAARGTEEEADPAGTIAVGFALFEAVSALYTWGEWDTEVIGITDQAALSSTSPMCGGFALFAASSNVVIAKEACLAEFALFELAGGTFCCAGYTDAGGAFEECTISASIGIGCAILCRGAKLVAKGFWVIFAGGDAHQSGIARQGSGCARAAVASFKELSFGVGLADLSFVGLAIAVVVESIADFVAREKLAGACPPLSVGTALETFEACSFVSGGCCTGVAGLAERALRIGLVVDEPVTVIVFVVAGFCCGCGVSGAGSRPFFVDAGFFSVLAGTSSTACLGTRKARACAAVGAGCTRIFVVDLAVAVVIFFVAKLECRDDFSLALLAPTSLDAGLFPVFACAFFARCSCTGIAGALEWGCLAFLVVYLAIAIVVVAVAGFGPWLGDLFADAFVSFAGVDTLFACPFACAVETECAEVSDIVDFSVAVFVDAIVTEFVFGDDLSFAAAPFATTA